MENEKLIGDFISNLKRRGKAKATIIAYQNDIVQLAQSNETKYLELFQESDIKHGLTYLQQTYSLSSKTVSRKLNSIRTFYRYLEDKKLIKFNPTKDILHPKFRIKKQRFLNKQEYLALREASRENFKTYLMVELLLQTGLRISELSRLKVKDIILLNKGVSYIFIEKFGSNAERKVPLNPKISTELKNYLLFAKNNKKPNPPLFSTKTGKSIEVRNIRSSIDRMIIKARIKNACVNDIRNTFIVFQLINGMSIPKLAEIVGHKNIATTTRYVELLTKKYKPKGIDKVVEL